MRPPHSLAQAIERRSLIERVHRHLERQVVVIQAPAGFGKTTLLTQVVTQLREHGVDHGWLTIDPSDSAPGRLVRGIVQALIHAGDSEGRPWDSLECGPEETDGAILEQALTRRRNRVVLILDDCHLADSPAFNTELDQIIRVLPDNVHIVLSGRAKPRISLSRARARGLLSELTASDMSFTRGEIEALFGAALDVSDVVAMLERTEGWPAMVQLTLQLGELGALGVGGRAMHAVLREYIAEQVLWPLAPTTRALLAKCSILTQFSAELAEAVSDESLDRSMRHELDQLAPLLTAVDDRPGWLRLHPMLRDVLTVDLEQAAKTDITRLHATAASWFGERGDLEAAVHHARAAANFILAVDTIQRAGGVRLFIRLGNSVLADLLDKLPPAVVHATSGLRLARAVNLSKQGRLIEARRLLEEVRASAQATAREPDVALQDDIVHVDDLIAIYEDRDVNADTIANRESEVGRVPVGDTWTRGWLYNHLTIYMCRYGELQRAQRAAHLALACYREERSTYVQVFMLIHLGLIAVASGRIALSLEPLREAEALIDSAHATDDGLRAIAQVPIAEALYAKNDLAGSRRKLDFAIPVMAGGEGWVDIFARALETRIRIALVEEGLGAAIAVLERGYEIAESRELWRLRWAMDAMRHEVMCRANLLIEADEIGQALRRDIAMGATAEGHILTWREKLAGNITLARGALYRNNAGAAMTWLDVAITEGEAVGVYLWLIPALLLRAIAKDRSGDAESALNAIQRAVAIAAPQGIVRPFIDEGRVITSLIRQLLRRFGIGSLSAANTEFVARILSPLSPAGETAEAGSSSLLSEREHEILGLLNHGLANKQIARSIGVSEATVKFHLKNLYAKLGVNSRAMALAVARQQHLLH